MSALISQLYPVEGDQFDTPYVDDEKPEPIAADYDSYQYPDYDTGDHYNQYGDSYYADNYNDDIGIDYGGYGGDLGDMPPLAPADDGIITVRDPTPPPVFIGVTTDTAFGGIPHEKSEYGLGGAVIDNPYEARSRTWVPSSRQKVSSGPSAFDVQGMLEVVSGRASSSSFDSVDPPSADATAQQLQALRELLELTQVGRTALLLNAGAAERMPDALESVAQSRDEAILHGLLQMLTALLDERDRDNGLCTMAPFAACVPPLVTCIGIYVADGSLLPQLCSLTERIVTNEQIPEIARTNNVLPLMNVLTYIARDPALPDAVGCVARLISGIVRHSARAALLVARDGGLGTALNGIQTMSAGIQTDQDQEQNSHSRELAEAAGDLAVLVSDVVFAIASSAGSAFSGVDPLIQQLVSLSENLRESTKVSAALMRLLGALSASNLTQGNKIDIPQLILSLLSRHCGDGVRLSNAMGSRDRSVGQIITEKASGAKQQIDHTAQKQKQKAVKERQGATLSTPPSDTHSRADDKCWIELNEKDVRSLGSQFQSRPELVVLCAEFSRCVARLNSRDFRQSSPDLLYAVSAIVGALAAAELLSRDTFPTVRRLIDGEPLNPPQADDQIVQVTAQPIRTVQPVESSVLPSHVAERIVLTDDNSGACCLALCYCAAEHIMLLHDAGHAHVCSLVAGSDLIRSFVALGYFRALAIAVQIEPACVPRILSAVPRITAAISTRGGLAQSSGCILAAAFISKIPHKDLKRDAAGIVVQDGLSQLETSLRTSSASDSSHVTHFISACAIFEHCCANGQKRRGVFARSPAPHTTLPRPDIAMLDVTAAVCRPVYVQLLIDGGIAHASADRLVVIGVCRALTAMKARRCLSAHEGEVVTQAQRLVRLCCTGLQTYKTDIDVELETTRCLKKASKCTAIQKAIAENNELRQLLAELQAERNGITIGALTAEDNTISHNCARIRQRAGLGN